MLRRIRLGLLVVIVLAVAAGALFVASRQNMKFDTPRVDVTASNDPAVIERGRYVVRNVVNCTSCHGDTTQMKAMALGEDIPLSGGYTWDIPPGKIRARNITPDPHTGIGRYTDSAVARALRFGVGPDGRALLPFMELQGLSDQDLVAVVSYLRTQPAVPHDVPMHEYNVLGRIIKATILANPVGPKETPLKVTPHGATVENGRYLVESVALCWACHTQRNPATGELVGTKFAGGI